MRSVRTVAIQKVRVAEVQDLSPPPSSFGVDLTRLAEPRFFLPAIECQQAFCLTAGRTSTRISAFSNLRPIFQDGTHMKTFSAKPHEVKREWFVVDATDKVLGRLATEIARRLRGKHKAIYTPHVDTGDFIVVTNVERLALPAIKPKTRSTSATPVTPAVLRNQLQEDAATFPGSRPGNRRQGHAAEGPAGLRHAEEAEVLRWRSTSSHRPAAQGSGNLRGRHG
jgi:large subunit ribosomal protein L13